MKKLHFDYFMQTEYSEVVNRCDYSIKCIPAETERQRLLSLNIENFPINRYSLGTDAFGNKKLYGCIDEDHNKFIFHISGEVYAGLFGFETEKNLSGASKYKYQYGLATPGNKLNEYYKTIKIKGNTNLGKSISLMNMVYSELSYVPNVTSIKTNAEEAWNLKMGVCQDYAHILIALCKMAGIPARYVTGMLIGEGASHAWVEILSDGKWYGLDPTNNVVVSDEHIKIGVGRDAKDCEINRGIIIGGGNQTLTICVNVEEVK